MLLEIVFFLKYVLYCKNVTLCSCSLHWYWFPELMHMVLSHWTPDAAKISQHGTVPTVQLVYFQAAQELLFLHIQWTMFQPTKRGKKKRRYFWYQTGWIKLLSLSTMFDVVEKCAGKSASNKGSWSVSACIFHVISLHGAVFVHKY